jgi:hypothetical protein
MSPKKPTPEQVTPATQPASSSNSPMPVEQAAPAMQSVPAEEPAKETQPVPSVEPSVPVQQSNPEAQQQEQAKEPARAAEIPAQPKVEQLRLFERFHWMQRVAHALLLATFTLLAITGLPQKFAQAGWAQAMIGFFGGIDTTRQIHHVSAIVMMLLAIYHLLDIGYKIFVRRTSLSMLPTLKDVQDALQAFWYNLGFGKTRPQMGRYTFEEKA